VKRRATEIVYTIADVVLHPLRLLRRRMGSAKGPWEYRFRRRFAYGDDTSYRKAVAFLDGYGDLEDWGCGTAYASKFVRASAYRGVDGSAGYADVVADLRLYRSRTPCLLMRHVLEHDLEWCKILDNAIASFERRMVLVVFTPFAEQTRVLKVGPSEIPDIAFAKRELLARIPSDCRVSEESLQTRSTYGREHLFYIDRPAPGEAPARLRV